MSHSEPADDEDVIRSVDKVEIRKRLDRVHDPELDRSIVELQYIDDIHLDGPRVTVEFILPTAWCSPAFAWMMATGIRDEVGTLPGIDEVHVELKDHMHDDQINRGVNERLAFQEVFEDADDGVEEVRRTLDRKARMARQYHAIEALGNAGLDPEQIVELTPDDLDHSGDRVVVYLRDGAVAVTAPADPITAYLDKAREVGVVTETNDPLFVGQDEEPIDPSEFNTVRRQSRLAKSNLSGQAGICSQLHEARYGIEINGD